MLVTACRDCGAGAGARGGGGRRRRQICRLRGARVPFPDANQGRAGFLHASMAERAKEFVEEEGRLAFLIALQRTNKDDEPPPATALALRWPHHLVNSAPAVLNGAFR